VFYESDCQGRFFSLLIAFRCSSLQSAPSEVEKMNESAEGWAEQSFSAGSCLVLSIGPCRRLQAIR
jgi:hypothetical protein